MVCVVSRSVCARHVPAGQRLALFIVVMVVAREIAEAERDGGPEGV